MYNVPRLHLKSNRRSPLWAQWAVGAVVRERSRARRGARERPSARAREPRTGLSGGRARAPFPAGAASFRSSDPAWRPTCGARRRHTRTTNEACAPGRSWWSARPLHCLHPRYLPFANKAHIKYKYRILKSVIELTLKVCDEKVYALYIAKKPDILMNYGFEQ